jgi:hypothetical protein
MGGECEYDVQFERYAAEESAENFQDILEQTTRNVIRRAALNTRDYRRVIIDQPNTTIDVWLSNGARVYQDLSLLEYATPEVLGPRAAAAADAAGILAVEALVTAADLPITGLYRRTGSVMPLANSYSTVRQREVTTGYHRNFIVPSSLLQKAGPQLAGILGSNLATSLWSWNGTLGPDGYEASQKYRGIGSVLSDSLDTRTVHGHKPMILYRSVGNHDHDVNPDWRWGRIEVRFADALFSRTANYLGFAATSLALRMAEHVDIIEDRLSDLVLDNPLRTMEKLATHPYAGSHTMADNRKFTADNLQESFAAAAEHLAQHVALPADEVAAIPLLFKAADLQRQAREQRDLRRLALIADTGRKFAILSRNFGDTITNANSEALWADLSYDRIDHFGPKQRTGYGRIAAAAGKYAEQDERYVPSAEVEYFRHGPPHDTRAADRAACIDVLDGTSPDELRYMSWSGYGVTYRDNRNYWPNPFAYAA